MYQRGKLDLPGVIARLNELLRVCPDFAEARAMLGAAERGTLRPEPHSFTAATLPPPAAASASSHHPRTDADLAPASIRHLEASLATPQAPGIPRAPLLPRFTPQGNVAPSYAPARDRHLTPPELHLELTAQPAVELTPSDGLLGQLAEKRNTAPSPGAPGPLAAEQPTLFAIATWLSERDFERALTGVEKWGSEISPELSILEVRALLGLGRKAAARRSIDRLCRAPLLDPDLRAAVARLLIELGDIDRAEAQARRAFAEDPTAELSRLTLAWALVRRDAWLPSARSAAELSELLTHFAPQASSLPALGYALSALAQLPGSAEAARNAAETALQLDPGSPDGLAVAALVAQRQRRSADARRLLQRLLDIDPHLADELSAGLTSLGLTLGRSAGPASSLGRSPWDEKEQRLALGDGKAALFEFEQGLSRKLEVVPARADAGELSRAAQIAARYLTESPVSRHFAPYDLSLFSISRLDVALGLLYRGGVGPRTELRSRVLLGLGAYAGECLRQAYAGDWVGSSVELLRMHVEGQGLHFKPFAEVNARLQSAVPLEVRDTPLAHPGAEPLGQRVTLSIAPPTPWDPAPWPELGRLPELGARLRESPVGLYCAGVELPLDLSFASLRSIDRYVTLLAPPLAPSDPEAAWVRRAAVLVGSYLGEVLRATHGGEWTEARSELCAEAYQLSLPGNVTALPVVAAFERLCGRRLEALSDYARRITG